MSVSAMYNPEIPPPTTTTSQDNGLKDDFSSSGKKIEKIEFKGYRKAVNVRFPSQRGRGKGNSTKYSVFAVRLCQTLSL